MKQHIPNALTLANLFCGCCALLFIFHGRLDLAAYCTAGSFLFDYADGMVARALGVSSPMGKELDSLADVVSFGVVPGSILYTLISGAASGNDPVELVVIRALPAFVLSVFSAYRLAKFNLDTRQTSYFLGLSTPACTVLVMGLGLAARHNHFGLAAVIQNQWFLYGLVAVLSALLVSEIPMFGMKVKRFDLRSNILNLVFAALFGVLIFLLKELALTAIIICYIALSIALKKQITHVEK